MLSNKELNEKISKIIGSYDYKTIPYIGWFWRDVDFTKPMRLGIIPSTMEIGFMENNKWGYPTIQLNEEQSKELISILNLLVLEMNETNLKRLNSLLDSFVTENIKFECSSWTDPFEEMYGEE